MYAERAGSVRAAIQFMGKAACRRDGNSVDAELSLLLRMLLFSPTPQS
jgi:hypothetical protein